MRLKLFAILFICLTFTLFQCKPAQSEEKPETKEQKQVETNKPVDSLDLMIGQMIMVGFRGTEIDSITELTEAIRNQYLGGVVLYEYDVPSKSRPRNISSAEQLKSLNQYLQSLRPETLLIGIDEEGGKVSRLKERYGFETIPSAQYLGEIDNTDSTRFFAAKNAQKLIDHGINLNFAPVVDLNVNPESPAIGAIERSFSADPKVVVKHMKAYLEAQDKVGVLGCVKHFPGHGSASSDSHVGFTDVSDSWSAIELQPYVDLIEQKIPGIIMTAHVFNKILDPKYPATLSAPTIRGLLRSKHRYEGVIISDDMHMGAISKQFGFEEGIRLAIAADVDILLFSNNIPGEYDPLVGSKIHQLIRKWVDEGEVSKDRIKQSYDRIRVLKSSLKN